VAAEFERPKKHSLPPQAALVLSIHGGHGTHRIPGQKVDGLISFEEAYAEVGGSYDDCHETFTTHAWSVVEGVNVADMLTADRVVSRMAVYYPAHGKEEPSFDITGSYFENLRIAGYPVEVKLDTLLHHEHNTYSKLASGLEKVSGSKAAAKAGQPPSGHQLLLGRGLHELSRDELDDVEENYHALKGMSGLVNGWKARATAKRASIPGQGIYRLSAANQLDFNRQAGSSEVKGYGGIVCIPKFGVVRLAEMVVHQHTRTLNMFQVQMCSSGHGTTSGGGTTGSGGVGP
jgi:hypothetical protein